MTRIPTKAEILAYVAENPSKATKRDIGRAFGVKGAAKIDLKALLREMQEEGHLEKRRRSLREPGTLPPVSVLSVGVDEDGDPIGAPMEWGGDGEPPVIRIVDARGEALGAGERVLARLQKTDEGYDARLIRRIGTNPARILGVFRKGAEGGRIVPISKGDGKEWRVPPGAVHGAVDGELVEAESAGPRSRTGLPSARIVERLGDPSAPKAVSLIAIHQHGIPDAFPDEAVAEADAQSPATLEGREDLRHLPLVTIDPADARDHDDAVWAHADDDPANEGGHVVWVAIADVAAHVAPGSALDREARKRGNSTYFPDRVVPMLPDRLSGDLCSLHEGVERAVVAVRMVLRADGEKVSHTFHRGLMRSRASLHYEEVQAAVDGDPTERAAALMEEVIAPLYAAYAALREARARREPLNLDLPERRIVLSEEGRVESVALKERTGAHRLIEEMMVLANVAAAEECGARRQPLLYRVHEEPEAERLDALRETVAEAGLRLAKGQVLRTASLNRLLDQAAGRDDAELVMMSVLRSMQQAYYGPRNFGHFGLALRAYAHFTSPIRRYADLVVHRALIRAHGWGPGLTDAEAERLEETGEHISETERRSMAAERDTVDRYLAAFLADRVGAEFGGTVSGVQRFGLFVRLDESGADGLVPIRSLGSEYWHHDGERQVLTGSDTGRELGLGQRVRVVLTEAVPVTGGLMLELVDVEGEPVERRPARRGKGPVRRKVGRAKAKERKLRKVTRRR